MSVRRKFTPEVRLKKLLGESGGVKVRDALAAANAGIESLRGRCMTAIDVKIENIAQHARAGDQASLKACYRYANEIYSEAAMYELKELSAAAHSLCDLLSVGEIERVPAEAIRVHVDSMRVLRSPMMSDNAAMRETVLAELRALSKRFAAAS